MILALALTAQLLTVVQSDDSEARVKHLSPSAEEAPVAQPAAAPPPPARGPSLVAGASTRRKSTSLILVGAQLGVGLLGGYLAFAVGTAVNFPRGGLSDPIDTNDVLLLMVLPATAAAAFAWVIGLFDAGQRSIFGSTLWALLGAAAGELIGVGAGTLLGRSLYPNSPGTAGLLQVLIGPALAAIGAVLFMELFKPGEELEPGASITVTRGSDGALVFGPALSLKF